MVISEFFRKAKKDYFRFSSQAQYVKSLLHAAGITKTYDDEYLRKLYSGYNHLTKSIKSNFPSNIDEDKLSQWFKAKVKEDSESSLMDSFGFGTDDDRFAFYKALSRQLIMLIQSEDEDVDDIVYSEYQNLLQNPEAQISLRPIYKNDSVMCFSRKSIDKIGIYDVLPYTWKITNKGSVIWKNRKLVFVNKEDFKLRSTSSEILIHSLKPGEVVELSTEFEFRGFEGSFLCKWELQDENGQNCFPGTSHFNIAFSVVFS